MIEGRWIKAGAQGGVWARQRVRLCSNLKEGRAMDRGEEMGEDNHMG